MTTSTDRKEFRPGNADRRGRHSPDISLISPEGAVDRASLLLLKYFSLVTVQRAEQLRNFSQTLPRGPVFNISGLKTDNF